MPAKPKKHWTDVKIFIAAAAVTGTLALWNIFAKANAISTTGSNIPDPVPDTPTVEPTPDGRVPELHVIVGQKAPVPRLRVVTISNYSYSAPGYSSSGAAGAGASASASGGGGSVTNPPPAPPPPAPPPVTSTGSSKP